MAILNANRRRWSRLFLLLAVPLAALAVVAYSYCPRSPFERYVTTPISRRGTKISLLIPIGWKPIVLPARGNGNLKITLKPAEPMPWLPKWVKRSFGNNSIFANKSAIDIYWLPIEIPQETDGFENGTPAGTFSVQRWWSRPAIGSFCIYYCRGDKQTLMSTYRAVLDSVAIL